MVGGGGWWAGRGWVGRWWALIFVMRLGVGKIENLHLAYLFVEEIWVGNVNRVANEN